MNSREFRGPFRSPSNQGQRNDGSEKRGKGKRGPAALQKKKPPVGGLVRGVVPAYFFWRYLRSAAI